MAMAEGQSVWVDLLFNMTKRRSTTCLVALGLLALLTWTSVGAQKKNYQQQRGQNAQSQGSSTSYNPSHKTPNTPEVSTCEVSIGQRVPCGNLGISIEECQAIDCCHDGRQCYFRKTVTVHCTRDGYFIVVAARCDTEPSIDVGSLRLMGQGDSCAAEATNSLFSVFRFPVSECGTVVMDDQGAIVYENSLTSTYVTQGGSGSYITRDSHYQVVFQCKYLATSHEQVNIQLGMQDPPLSVHEQGPVNVELKLANGECHQKGCSDESYYSSFYTEDDYPIRKALKDPVYVEVNVLNRNDPDASLLLHRCWATKDAHPHSMPQWDILINGCPNIADSDNIKLVPSDSQNYGQCKRFMFRMFAFVTPSAQKTTSNQQVYIHCSTSLCLTRPGNSCEQPCYLRDQRMKRNIVAEGLKTVTTSKALVIEGFPED